MLQIQEQLGICQPLICENGAALYMPVSGENNIQWQRESFATSRGEILDALNSIRDEKGWRFTGFADCDTQGIADMTGLYTGRSSAGGRAGIFRTPAMAGQ